jgi:hypothetical protein
MTGGLRGFCSGVFVLVWVEVFVQSFLTLKCAVIAAFTDKVNIYFLLFFVRAETSHEEHPPSSGNRGTTAWQAKVIKRDGAKTTDFADYADVRKR